MSSPSKRKITIAGSDHQVLLVEHRDKDGLFLIEYDGIPFEIFLGTVESGNRLALLDGIPFIIGEATKSQGTYRLPVNGKRIQVFFTPTGHYDSVSHVRQAIEVSRLRGARHETGRMIAHMPGRIVSVKVKSGDSVRVGDPILVLLAMKMENTLVAPSAGTVREIHVDVGVTVNKGDLLVLID